ncbi:MAG: hypothetical protein AB7P08_00575 [Burkholderiales bacterium]
MGPLAESTGVEESMIPTMAASRMSALTIKLMALFVLVSLPACATSYSALPISARVVDADTNEPLADVIVVVEWEYEYHRREISESLGRGTFEFAETTTNMNGDFTFPGWGPKEVPRDTPGRAFLGPNNPTLALFKPGYLYEVKTNPLETAYLDDRNYVGDLVRHSTWNGKAIRLKRKAGDTGEYVLRISHTSGLPGWYNCNWERIPRMLSALVNEGERLRAAGIRNYVMRLRDVERSAGEGCRSVKDVLGPFLK